ncbi:hemin uptake protein HemP [Aestuariibius insulae]|uniref:hemin uptake protein HemP n=1 Tax=Aestuariibius insulae TaxID=2058287 RepID=UPI00345E425F
MSDLQTRTDASRTATYDARKLMEGCTQACIVLDGQTYILRITRAGKLILTK